MSHKNIPIRAEHAVLAARGLCTILWDERNAGKDPPKEARDWVSFLEGYLQASVEASGKVPRQALKYIDSAKTAIKEEPGKMLWAKLTPPEEGKDPQRAVSWEKIASASAAAETLEERQEEETATVLPSPLPETAEDEAKLLASTQACVVAFCFRSAGSLDRPFHIQVGGMHPKELVERNAKTDEERARLWAAAGDRGTAVMLRCCALRLPHVDRAAVLGGFTDLMRKEVRATHTLFRESGEHGAAARLAWKALRLFEDEVEAILDSRSHNNRGVLDRITGRTPATAARPPASPRPRLKVEPLTARKRRASAKASEETAAEKAAEALLSRLPDDDINFLDDTTFTPPPRPQGNSGSGGNLSASRLDCTDDDLNEEDMSSSSFPVGFT
eukprot:Hpha_TRINITY_DN15768_c1_g3::TRINITY_DN15768_c1_g3_i2::g.40557::m.40557